MKRTFLILTWIALAGVALTPAAAVAAQVSRQGTEARKLWEEGRGFYDHRNFPEAEKKFREALSKYPRAEQADRTAYYLIITLEQLKRIPEARTEVENFLRNYPESKWSDDVNGKRLTLGGREALGAQEAKMASDRALDLQAVALRQLLQMSPANGLENARNRLNANPDDPVVVSNLSTLYFSHSPEALLLLLGLSINPAASPKTRENAVYWIGKTPDKTQVAAAFMDKLAKVEDEAVVSEALRKMAPAEHRAVLQKIAESSNPEKFSAMEKINRGGSTMLRTDLVTIVARVQAPRALDFILNVAENDRDPVVRQTALNALMSRKDMDATTLANILKTAPRLSRPAVRPR
jgi:tetratricopeptide (TPR) repeat protein